MTEEVGFEMSRVIPLRGLKDTTLWKMLDTGFDETADEEVSRFLASNLLVSCQEASERMKSTISLHKQFTLHDETHLLRVTELMAKIMPERTLKDLNPIEILDCTPDSRQLVKQRYLKQTPLRTVLEIYSQELNAASSCCTPSQ